MSLGVDVHQLTEIQQLMAQVEQRWFQAYVNIEFCRSNFSWGVITWRYEMSGGPDGHSSFNSLEHARDILQYILDQGPNRNLRSEIEL